MLCFSAEFAVILHLEKRFAPRPKRAGRTSHAWPCNHVKPTGALPFFTPKDLRPVFCSLCILILLSKLNYQKKHIFSLLADRNAESPPSFHTRKQGHSAQTLI